MRLDFVAATAIILSLFVVAATSYSQEEPKIKQILLGDFILQYTDYGEYADTAYREFYNPLNLFDNLVNTTYSFWSQYGNSGYTIDLKGQLNQPVCSVELYVFNPQNSPFSLFIGDKEINGFLDSTIKQIPIKDCVNNVSKISMNINAEGKWSTIEELKLFTEEKTPPVEPPVCPPNSYWDANLQKCVAIQNPVNGTTIINSTITLSVHGSEITINADETSKVNIPPKQSIIPEEEDEKDKKDNKEDEDK